MIREEIRQTVRTLHKEGKDKKEIVRILGITIKTVRKIINEKPSQKEEQKISNIEGINLELLKRLHEDCNGYKTRIHEILMEDYKIKIGYSYLTQLIRENNIGEPANQRCCQVPDKAGEEMQHDTTVYKIKINGVKTKVICSGIYFRFSKIRYIKFYKRFNRFIMKCFIHEALMYYGYAAKKCIIDNTNLAVLYGSGSRAVIVPEMVEFAKNYGFEWKAHEIGHANRKAGKERNFMTVESNFLPGRTFKSWEDLNNKARQWATERYANRCIYGTKLIPLNLFEEEKTHLNKLSKHILPPCRPDKRLIDQYGYISFDANYYYIPGKFRGQVDTLEYSDKIKVYKNRKELIKYDLPPVEIKNKKFNPEGMDTPPCEPKNIKKSSKEEEKELNKIDSVCSEYIQFIKSKECHLRQKNRFIRNLYLLSKKLSRSLFIKVIQTSLDYKVSDYNIVEQLSITILNKENIDSSNIIVDNDLESRKSYLEGKYCNESDISGDYDIDDNPEKGE